jgi:cbb3-type cytochrome oxidase subunit 3
MSEKVDFSWMQKTHLDLHFARPMVDLREAHFVRNRRRVLTLFTFYTLAARYSSLDAYFLILLFSYCVILYYLKNARKINVQMAKRNIKQRVGWAKQWAGGLFKRNARSNDEAEPMEPPLDDAPEGDGKSKKKRGIPFRKNSVRDSPGAKANSGKRINIFRRAVSSENSGALVNGASNEELHPNSPVSGSFNNLQTSSDPATNSPHASYLSVAPTMSSNTTVVSAASAAVLTTSKLAKKAGLILVRRRGSSAPRVDDPDLGDDINPPLRSSLDQLSMDSSDRSPTSAHSRSASDSLPKPIHPTGAAGPGRMSAVVGKAKDLWGHVKGHSSADSPADAASGLPPGTSPGLLPSSPPQVHEINVIGPAGSQVI